VVNDSLVLIEFINKAYESGLSRREAIVAGTNIRLRPIILTTLTTTLGLLPMALGIPEYSLVWGTMAMTFVTGLCTATFLTIIIVPVEWDMMMAFKERRIRQPGVDQLPTIIKIKRLDKSSENLA
jgi:multidrug efflux pump subunit AcrB